MAHKPSLFRRLWRSISRRGRGLSTPPRLRLEPLETRALLSVSPQGGGFTLDWEDLGLTGERTQVADGIWYLGPGYAPHQVAQREPENINAADTTNTDQLWSGGGLGLNLTGAGLTVGIWDQGGVRTTHKELVGRVTLVDNVALADHSTHVAGTIGASGVVANAKGMASQVNILSYDWNNDFNEMRAAAGSIVASNHSYATLTGWATMSTGSSPPFTDVWYEDRATYTEDTKFGKYDASAAELDDVIYDNPSLLSVWAAGNDRDDAFGNVHFDQTYFTYLSTGPSGAGWYQVSTAAFSAPPSDGANGGYDSLPPTQTAKNSLVVGAVNDINADPYTNANVLLAPFSSFGPTDDGRIKPDLVANGTSVFSSVANSDGSYLTMSGTSMAAPNVTGSAVLLAQHYQNLFGSLPLAATQKALMIHTAFDAGNPGPDYANGWGLLDSAAAANLLTAAAGANPTSSVLPRSYTGTEQTYQFTSTGGLNNPLKATIAWIDPAGTAQPAGLDIATSVLVDDLDIWVTGPGGTYFPWNLDPSNPSAAAFQTSANHRDNVEQVLISAPTAGTYTLHVGRTGASFNQNYSLIVSGGTLDTALPTVDVLDVTPDPRNSAVAAITLQFSEAVTGFDLADLSLTRNGGANLLTGSQTLTTGNNISFTLNNLSGLTGTAGNYVLTLNAVGSGIQDLSSNLLISGASDSWTVDTTAPTADVVDVTPDPRGSSVPSLQIVFSEAVSGFDLADLSLTRNGGANLLTGSQTLTTSDNITYTLNNLAGLTGTSGSYVLTLTAAASGIADTAGNLLAGNASDAWVVDTSVPTVDITDVSPDPRNTAVSSIQIVFNKAVTGFDTADLSLTRNGGGNLLTASQTLTTVDNIVYTLNNVSGLTGASGSYLLTLTAAGSGIIDALANPLASGATDAWVVDLTPPTADIVDVSPDPRGSAVGSIQIVFSEAVSGFDLADLSLTRNGGANLLTGSQTLTTSDNITYTLNNLTGLTGTSGNYLLTLTAAASGIADTAGNLLAGNASDAWVVDTSVPTVDITDVTPDPRNTAVGSIQMVFNKAVTGFDLADLSLTRNGGGNLLTGSQTLTTSDNITFTLNNLASLTGASGSYLLTLTAAGSGIIDAVANPLASGASDAWVVDLTPPTADIVDVSPDPRTSSVPSIQIVFSEAVSGFDLADLALTLNGGSNLLTGSQTLTTSDNITFTLNNLAGLTGQPGTYQLTLNGTGAGIADLLGNAFSGSASDGWFMSLTEIQAENFTRRTSGNGHQWWTVDQETAGVGVFSGATGPSADFMQALTTAGQDSSQGNISGPLAPSLEYDVTITTPGTYNLKVRVAGISSASDSLWVDSTTGTLSDAQGNETVGSALKIETGATGAFQTRDAGRWLLSAGLHTFRISMRESGAAIDAFQLIAPTSTSIAGPTEIQAENYSNRQDGGSHRWWVADLETPGAGVFTGATGPSQDYVQALNLSGQDTSFGNLSPAAPYIDYTIEVPTTGAYSLQVRTAGLSSSSDSLWASIPTGSLQDSQGNPLTGGALQIATNATGAFELRSAGVWLLPAGTHTIRLQMRESGAAVDSLLVTPVAAVPIIGTTEIQAENFARRQSGNNHQWAIIDLENPGVGNFSGATGSGQDFLQSLNLTYQDTTVANLAPAAPSVEYDIQVSDAGIYDLKLRVAGVSGNSDSLWVEIPTGTLNNAQGNATSGSALLINTNSTGVFELKNAGRWNLTPGNHTVRVSMRESGAAIDSLQVVAPSVPTPIVGLTEIQAETFSRRQSGNGHQWSIVDQETAGAGVFTGATGPSSDYVQSLTTSGQDSAFGTSAPGTPSVEYDIQVSSAGTYELKLRVAGLNTSSDSLWVEVPTGTLSDAQGNAVTGGGLRIDTNSTGVFTLKSAGRWNLSAGVHTIRISMRESGAAVDSLQIGQVSAALGASQGLSAGAFDVAAQTATQSISTAATTTPPTILPAGRANVVASALAAPSAIAKPLASTAATSGSRSVVEGVRLQAAIDAALRNWRA